MGNQELTWRRQVTPPKLLDTYAKTNGQIEDAKLAESLK
ncbi:MAG: hypothetical protein CM15mP116_01560 [Synechococcus sp.]|nr:MAG: hypothetical protein CM15mP116_01560 [Synechococcus sp.]